MIKKHSSFHVIKQAAIAKWVARGCEDANQKIYRFSLERVQSDVKGIVLDLMTKVTVNTAVLQRSVSCPQTFSLSRYPGANLMKFVR